MEGDVRVLPLISVDEIDDASIALRVNQLVLQRTLISMRAPICLCRARPSSMDRIEIHRMNQHEPCFHLQVNNVRPRTPPVW